MTARRALAAAALVLGLALAGGLASARPGGGHSYSGGGGSYSGGGGSYSGGGGSYSSGSSGSWSSGGSSYSSGGGSYAGGGDAFGMILALGVLVIVVVGKAMFADDHGGAVAGWSPTPTPVPYRPDPPDLDGLRRLDPGFSQVLFEDFAYRLVAQAHRARGEAGGLDALAPYLRPEARAQLAARPPTGVAIDHVVVGSLRVAAVDAPAVAVTVDGRPFFVRLTLDVELNYTADGERPTTSYARERWHLSRAANLESRPPARARDFGCPNCGATFTGSDRQTCAHCDQVVDNGRFDWVVTKIEVREEEARPPALTGTVPEVGTDWRTVEHPASIIRWHALRQEDPALTDEAMRRRLVLIFERLNEAWNEDDLARARPYVSDGLYDYLRYWLDAYRRQGLRNRNDDAVLVQWMVAKVVRDRHHDAITVRLWGKGLDTTRDASGALVGGSATAPRAYSEYWTLIRGASVRGAPRTEPVCPNCGAALAIAMAGSCEHCGAHVTAGEFDWVLSKIEQDEAYLG